MAASSIHRYRSGRRVCSARTASSPAPSTNGQRHRLGNRPRRLPLRQPHHQRTHLAGFLGFGLAPVGYDPALLYAYSLLAPRTATRIRAEFPVLDTPAGQTALLVVAADLLQSASRGDHPELTEPLHALVASIAK